MSSVTQTYRHGSVIMSIVKFGGQHFEDTRKVFRTCNSKDRLYNVQKKKMRKGQTMVYKILHRKIKIVQYENLYITKNDDERRCSVRVSSSYSTSDTRLVTLVETCKIDTSN